MTAIVHPVRSWRRYVRQLHELDEARLRECVVTVHRFGKV